MTTRYRAFTRDFVEFMALRTAWPTIERTENWFHKEFGRSVSRKYYTALKRGKVVSERLTYGLVCMMMRGIDSERPGHTARALLEYLARAGVNDPAHAALDRVTECTCTPPGERGTRPDGSIDFLQVGLRAVGEVLVSRRKLMRYVQGCSEQHVHDAVRWIFTVVGREAIPGNEELPIDHAIQVASGFMRITLEEYQRRAMEWWRFNPWTVVLARGEKRPSAVSIALPLSEQAYNAILNGRQMTYDCRPDHFAVPAHAMLLEAIAERPPDAGAEKGNPTKALFFALLAQAGVFTSPAYVEHPTDIRLLVFAATPTNRKRLTETGYHATGCRMPGTGLEYFEKIVPSRPQFGKETLLVALARHFGMVIDGPPDP